jgi:hypothetical protein
MGAAQHLGTEKSPQALQSAMFLVLGGWHSDCSI